MHHLSWIQKNFTPPHIIVVFQEVSCYTRFWFWIIHSTTFLKFGFVSKLSIVKTVKNSHSESLCPVPLVFKQIISAPNSIECWFSFAHSSKKRGGNKIWNEFSNRFSLEFNFPVLLHSPVQLCACKEKAWKTGHLRIWRGRFDQLKIWVALHAQKQPAFEKKIN